MCVNVAVQRAGDQLIGVVCMQNKGNLNTRPEDFLDESGNLRWSEQTGDLLMATRIVKECETVVSRPQVLQNTIQYIFILPFHGSHLEREILP